VSSPFRKGDPCLLYDAKGRRYLIELIAGAEFQYHRGVLTHDDVIGAEEGVALQSSMGSTLVALRPRLADYVLKMGRGATVVYPKDAGAIVMWADIAPGQVVLEAGTGSGGLTMVLARAVVPGGRVVSVERREDHQKRARKLITGFFGEIPETVELRTGEVEEMIGVVEPDRIVLDVPEPWHSVEAAAEHLAPGGVFCCYLPTVPQVQSVRQALNDTRRFMEVSTFEVLMREWSVEGRSVRPSHRMIGHTGFITVARRYSPLEAP
jgi:tRNA (adenine57-N1/adenine58-N1)-methyltransferase